MIKKDIKYEWENMHFYKIVFSKLLSKRFNDISLLFADLDKWEVYDCYQHAFATIEEYSIDSSNVDILMDKFTSFLNDIKEYKIENNYIIESINLKGLCGQDKTKEEAKKEFEENKEVWFETYLWLWIEGSDIENY